MRTESRKRKQESLHEVQGLCVIGNFIPITQNAPRGYAHFILYRNENQEIKGIIARMKRIKKQAVLESITLLENANEYVTADLQPEELMNILTQCQEAAILTGNDLETQGESTKELVTMLEDYCELLYQISQSLDDTEKRRQLAQKVRELLISLHRKLLDVLPEDKKEIVFLPYKASMWDSLESVWKAADADPECDAYVIPIPYYDKNPDGSFREMHYEGDLFPDNVPITRYDAYSLEKRRPDAIYIHNPYDGANYVTSVHPDYYSDKLKQYTNCLVYIPYYLLGENYYEQYVNVPATIMADYVILPSENAKKSYIRVLNRIGNIPYKFMEKFVVLGSPKLDLLCQYNAEELMDCGGMEKMIRGRQCVLYNTGISGILNNVERELEKIEDTIRYFAINKEYVLWWRPHPLMEATLKSMRPMWVKRYKRIVEEYKKDCIGIYDDSTNLQRAIRNTNAYFGDDSSLTYLYGILGKPIMMQSVLVSNIIHGRKNQNVMFYASEYYDGWIYMVPRGSDCLMRIYKTGEIIENLGNVPGYENGAFRNCGQIVRCGKKLYLIPDDGYGISTYCLDTKQIEEISNKKDLHNIIYATSVEDRIVMINRKFSYIYSLHISSTEVCTIKVPFDLEELDASYHVMLNHVSNNAVIYKEHALFLIPETNKIVDYYYVTGKVTKLEIGDANTQFSCLMVSGEYLICIPYNDNSEMWLYDGEKTRVAYYGEKYKKIKSIKACLNGYYKDGIAYFLKNHGTKLYDIQDNNLKEIEMHDQCSGPCLFQDTEDGSFFLTYLSELDGTYKCCIISSDKLTVRSCINLMYDMAENPSHRIHALERELQTAIDYRMVEYQGESLKDLLREGLRVNKEEAAYYQGIYANCDGTAGKNIYLFIKGLI